jgi:hypothetical protein
MIARRSHATTFPAKVVQAVVRPAIKPRDCRCRCVGQVRHQFGVELVRDDAQFVAFARELRIVSRKLLPRMP